MREAMVELRRSENMIKHQDEIMNRPKKEWIMGKDKRARINKRAREELSTIKDRFEGQFTNKSSNMRKREKKRQFKD